MKFEMSKNTESPGLNFRFEDLEVVLPYIKDEEFDFQEINRMNSSWGIVKFYPNRKNLSFEISEGNLKFQLCSNGCIEIDALNSSDLEIEFKTFGDIFTKAPVNVNSLKLIANNIEIKHEVYAKQNIICQIIGNLKNQRSLKANGKLVILGAGKLDNSGLVFSKDKMRIRLRSIQNFGAIICKDLRIHLSKSKTSALAAHDPNFMPIIFENEGLCFGVSAFALRVSGVIENKNKGGLFSEQDLYISTTSKFTNNAKIAAGGKLIIDAYLEARNNEFGTLYANKEILGRFYGSLHNFGKIFSNEQIRILVDRKFTNHPFAHIFSKCLKLQSSMDFTNSSLIEALEKAFIGSDMPIENREQGKILANKDVELIGLKKLNNFGLVTGHKNLTTRMVGDTYNAKNAKMSGTTVLMSSHRYLDNWGEISASKLIDIMSRSVHMKKESTLVSNDKTHIKSESIVAAGLCAAKRSLHIECDDLINKILTGEMISLGEIILKIENQFQNENVIRAADITISGGSANNDGIMIATRIFCGLAQRFSNSEKAKLLALQAFDLISKGDIDISGNIESKGNATLQAGIDLIISLTAKISAEEWLKFKSAGTIQNMSKISTNGDILIDALHRFTNLATGEIEAENIKIVSDIATNDGRLMARKNLSVHSRFIFDALLQSLIEAGNKVELFSDGILENSGNIESNTIIIKSKELLKNLEQGHVVSESDLSLISEYILSNAGKLLSKKDMLLKSGNWFINHLEGKIRSAANVSIESLNRLDNNGEISAKNRLMIKALMQISNHQHGKLSAEESLSLISKYCLDNDGEIESEGELTADIKYVLGNFEKGKITAKCALNLFGALIIKNSGAINAMRNLSVKAEKLLCNSGKMNAKSSMDLLSSFAIENEGLVVAEGIRLEAIYLLENAIGAKISASEYLKTKSQFSLNSGEYHSENAAKMEAEVLRNLSTGKITVKESLEIISKYYLENSGYLGSLKKLSLIVQGTLNNLQGGTLQANEAIKVLAKNLYLIGQLMAKGDFDATIEEEFDYNPATLWACGLLKLMLRKGYDFTKPINTPGSLNLESLEHLTILTNFNVGKNFTAKAANITVEKGNSEKSGVFANGKMYIEAVQQLRIGNDVSKATAAVNSDGSYLVSNGNMSLKGSSIQLNLSEIYTTSDLLLAALSVIENSGNINVSGNAEITAALFSHKLITHTESNACYTHTRALSAKPTMTVGKDCTIKANTEILGANLHSGGKLNTTGNFQANSFEEFLHWYEIHKVKGKRKGPGRGHHYHEQKIPKHKTLAIYDSQVSSAIKINMNNASQFKNGGAFRSPEMSIEFQQFSNGNTIPPSSETQASRIPLEPFFKENSIFGRSNKKGFVYGPKFPLTFNHELAPPVHLGSGNPIADLLFEPILEKDKVQDALHEVVRSGYLHKPGVSPSEVLVELRNNAYQLFKNKHPSVLTAPYITEEDLIFTGEPLLYYVAGKPIVFIPPIIHQQIGMSSKSEAVIKADNAILQGNKGSTFENTDKIDIKESLDVSADSVINRQPTETVWKAVVENRKKGVVYVPEIKAEKERGSIKAGKLKIKSNFYKQVGGEVSAGSGGMEFIIRDQAVIEALRTTVVNQGNVTSRGKNYEVEPVFIPAHIKSSASITILVTEGPFTATGMLAEAKAKVIINSAKDIAINDNYEPYELASEQCGRHHKKKKTGGTSFSSLPSVILGGEGIDIQSDQGMIQMIHTCLFSGGDINLNAKTLIEILNRNAESSRYAQHSSIRGFKHTNQHVDQRNTHVLASEIISNACLNISAETEVRIRALHGLIREDVSIAALNVILEGAYQEQSTKVTTKCFGVDFFGASALEAVLQNKHASEVIKELLKEEKFIDAIRNLSHSKSKSEKFAQATKTLIEGWRLAAIIAAACGRTNEHGSKGDVWGSLTDRWGITTSVKDKNGNVISRSFNPKFTFSYSQSITKTTSSQVVPTTLMIGGDLYIVADVIKLKDGTEISAHNISMFARKLLEISAAKNSNTSRRTEVGGSVSIHLDGTLAGASAHHAQQHSESLQHQNASIKARNILSLLVEGRLEVKGAKLEARNVVIKAYEMVLASLQDTESDRGSQLSVSVGVDGNNNSVSAGRQTASSKWVKNPTQIHAEQTLEILTDYLTQEGSILSSNERIKIKGFTGKDPIQWKYTDIQDKKTSKDIGGSLGYHGAEDSFPVTGDFRYKKSKEDGITRATVSAPIIEGELPSGINQDLKKVQEITYSKRTSIALPIVIPNTTKIAEDASNIAAAFKQNNSTTTPIGTDKKAHIEKPTNVPSQKIPENTPNREVEEEQNQDPRDSIVEPNEEASSEQNRPQSEALQNGSWALSDLIFPTAYAEELIDIEHQPSNNTSNNNLSDDEVSIVAPNSKYNWNTIFSSGLLSDAVYSIWDSGIRSHFRNEYMKVYHALAEELSTVNLQFAKAVPKEIEVSSALMDHLMKLPYNLRTPNNLKNIVEFDRSLRYINAYDCVIDKLKAYSTPYAKEISDVYKQKIFKYSAQRHNLANSIKYNYPRLVESVHRYVTTISDLSSAYIKKLNIKAGTSGSLAAVIITYDIATAEDKAKATANNAAGLAGGLIGGKMFGEAARPLFCRSNNRYVCLGGVGAFTLTGTLIGAFGGVKALEGFKEMLPVEWFKNSETNKENNNSRSVKNTPNPKMGTVKNLKSWSLIDLIFPSAYADEFYDSESPFSNGKNWNNFSDDRRLLSSHSFGDDLSLPKALQNNSWDLSYLISHPFNITNGTSLLSVEDCYQIIRQPLDNVVYPIGEGLCSVWRNYFKTFRHPLDNIVYPILDLVWDFAVIHARHDPEWNDDEYLKHTLYPNATSRMRSRLDSFINFLNALEPAFTNANLPNKIQMATEITASILAPGYALNGIKAVSNFHHFNMYNPPKFHAKSSKGVRPVPVKKLSSHEVRECLDEIVPLIYVITEGKKLFITTREYGGHLGLGLHKPVYAAGEIYGKNGKITRINNGSGSYLPHGEHMRDLVEFAFVRQGYLDAIYRFKDLHEIPGWKSPIHSNPKIVDTIITRENFAIPSFPGVALGTIMTLKFSPTIVEEFSDEPGYLNQFNNQKQSWAKELQHVLLINTTVPTKAARNVSSSFLDYIISAAEASERESSIVGNFHKVNVNEDGIWQLLIRSFSDNARSVTLGAYNPLSSTLLAASVFNIYDAEIRNRAHKDFMGEYNKYVVQKADHRLCFEYVKYIKDTLGTPRLCRDPEFRETMIKYAKYYYQNNMTKFCSKMRDYFDRDDMVEPKINPLTSKHCHEFEDFLEEAHEFLHTKSTPWGSHIAEYFYGNFESPLNLRTESHKSCYEFIKYVGRHISESTDISLNYIKGLRVSGALLGAAGLALSSYNVATADDKSEAVIQEVAGLTGSILGGMAGGTLAGMACGPASPICSAAGGFVGGMAGALTYAYGSTYGYRKISDLFSDSSQAPSVKATEIPIVRMQQVTRDAVSYMGSLRHIPEWDANRAIVSESTHSAKEDFSNPMSFLPLYNSNHSSKNRFIALNSERSEKIPEDCIMNDNEAYSERLLNEIQREWENIQNAKKAEEETRKLIEEIKKIYSDEINNPYEMFDDIEYTEQECEEIIKRAEETKKRNDMK